MDELDPYATVALYLVEDLKTPKNQNYFLKDLKEMSQSVKKFVDDSNYTIINDYGVIVLGTRKASVHDVLDIQEGY